MRPHLLRLLLPRLQANALPSSPTRGPLPPQQLLQPCTESRRRFVFSSFPGNYPTLCRRVQTYRQIRSYTIQVSPVMAHVTVSPTDSLLKLLIDSFPNLSVSSKTGEDRELRSQLKLTAGEKPVEGTNTIASYISKDIFPEVNYSEIEQAEVNQWLSLSVTQINALSGPSHGFLNTLNEHLKTRSTLLGEKESVADVAVYVRLREWVKKWTPEERTGGTGGGWRYIVRFVDWVENSPVYGPLKVDEGDRVKVDVNDVRTRLKIVEPAGGKKEGGAGVGAGAGTEESKKGKKEKKGVVQAAKDTLKEVVEDVKRVAATTVQAASISAPAVPAAPPPSAETAAAVTATPVGEGKKKEKAKKEKAGKPTQPLKEESTLNPSLIDLRVGQILKCIPHPNADSLYLSTISCGDGPDSTYINPYPDPENPDYPPTRTVLSGLKGKIPIEEMQGRRVVVVCNLKPSALRGVKSYAMVLAASPKADDGGKLELVSPPTDAKVGERIVFENYDEVAPESQLNPKKKVWEAIQPGFTTNEEFEVIFDGNVVYSGKEGEQTDTKLNKGLGRLVTQGARSPCRVVSLVGASVR